MKKINFMFDLPIEVMFSYFNLISALWLIKTEITWLLLLLWKNKCYTEFSSFEH